MRDETVGGFGFWADRLAGRRKRRDSRDVALVSVEEDFGYVSIGTRVRY